MKESRKAHEWGCRACIARLREIIHSKKSQYCRRIRKLLLGVCSFSELAMAEHFKSFALAGAQSVLNLSKDAWLPGRKDSQPGQVSAGGSHDDDRRRQNSPPFRVSTLRKRAKSGNPTIWLRCHGRVQTADSCGVRVDHGAKTR
jgi:hypothetical protein